MEPAQTASTPVAAAASGKCCTFARRLGRGAPDIKNLYINKCSCKRDKTIVLCRSCGYHFNGRIRIKCDKHPRVIFLQDLEECPRCRCPTYLDEYIETLNSKKEVLNK